jgi:hypothetical protein
MQVCNACPILESCRTWALTDLVLDAYTKTVVGGMREYEIAAERKRLGITPPHAPAVSTVKPHLLAVTSSADKDAAIRRMQVVRAHNLGHHETRPAAGCPRCVKE